MKGAQERGTTAPCRARCPRSCRYLGRHAAAHDLCPGGPVLNARALGLMWATIVESARALGWGNSDDCSFLLGCRLPSLPVLRFPITIPGMPLTPGTDAAHSHRPEGRRWAEGR